MKTTKICLILTLSAITGCSRTENVDASAEKQQIRDNFDNWLRGVENGDVDDYFNYLTNDFVILTPGMKPINNRDTLRAFLSAILSDYNFSMDWTSHEIEIRDDLAIHRYSGIASIKSKNDTTIVKSDRNYLDVLKKNDKGEWKVYIHSFN